MNVAALSGTILGFVGIVAVGWLLRRFGVLDRSHAQPINALIIYAGLPALIFQAVHRAQLDVGFLLVAAVAWVVFAVTALLAWGVSRAMRLARPVAGGFILTAALGNTGYIGYPVAQALLGERGLVEAVFYDVFGTVAALLFVGLVVAERFGTAEENRLNPFVEAVRFPAVLALFAGLALHTVPVPVPVSDGLDSLARMVVPLIMISVGLSLRPGCMREFWRPLAVGAVLRLAIAPLVAFAVGSFVLGDPDSIRLVVIEGGVPAMMLTLVIGARFKLDTDYIASAILVTTVLSVLTIPLAQVLVG